MSILRGFNIDAEDLLCEPVAVARFILNSWFHAPADLCGVESMRDAIVKQITPFLHPYVVWDCPGKPYLSYGGTWLGFEGTSRYIDLLLREADRSGACNVDFVIPLAGNKALASGTQVLTVDDRPFPVSFKNTYTFDMVPTTLREPAALKLKHYKNEFDALEVVSRQSA